MALPSNESTHGRSPPSWYRGRASGLGLVCVADTPGSQFIQDGPLSWDRAGTGGSLESVPHLSLPRLSPAFCPSSSSTSEEVLSRPGGWP